MGGDLRGCEAAGEYRRVRGKDQRRDGKRMNPANPRPSHLVNPLLDRGSERKTESYENKQDGEWEVASDEQAEYFNPIIENEGEKREPP